MLTLRELKNMAEIPPPGRKLPTAKELRLSGELIAEQEIGADAGITAYKSGYAVYRAGGAATVFRIHSCDGYRYGSGGDEIGGKMFENGAWHLRLVLEGEDRLCRNREARAQERSISYSAESEEWAVLDAGMEPVLERLIREETVDELLSALSDRQRQAVVRFCLERKTKRQIAGELGVTVSAVSRMLAKSLGRMRASLSAESGSGLSGRRV